MPKQPLTEARSRLRSKTYPPPKPCETNGRAHKTYASVFQTFGVEFRINGTEALADACPWCGKDRFYLNVTTGQYDCKKCKTKGNVTTYLTWLHKRFLDQTTPDHYLALKAKRGIASQTLKIHELAYDPAGKRWLVPFKNSNGNVVNIQLYYPDREKDNKRWLPMLPTALYGFDKLMAADKKKIVLLCEGPFDAIALDYNIGATKRDRQVIVATPGAFKAEWAEHFQDRKVRALYDNDEGGRGHTEGVRKLLGESGVAAELRLLKWPDGFPDGYDINDLAVDPKHKGLSIVGWAEQHCIKIVAKPKLVVQHGRRPVQEERPTDWPWPDHLRCGTYVSFSGEKGTFKSTIMQEVAARYTKGEKMPTCDRVEMPAGHVLYVYAEDDRDAVENGFERAGGDFDKWHAMPAVLKDGDPLNVLDHLEEMRQVIREYGIRLVIIDGQNSVVGAPNISTDMLARNNVTNKLHQFAQKENICLIGIRNEDSEGRALGPQSMGDLGRCVLRAIEIPPKSTPPYCKLEFVRISDVARSKYPDIFFSVEDLGGSARKILWEKVRPNEAKEALDKSRAQREAKS